jgi:hypothetical protein
MKRKGKLWTHRIGGRGSRIVVFERWPGGPIQMRGWNPSERKVKTTSLRHRDRERAKQQAADAHAKLLKGDSELLAGRVSLARLFTMYLDRRKTRGGISSEDERRTKLWTRYLGATKDPHKISLGEWETFIELRRTGAINGYGHPIAEGERRPVRIGTVAADLGWLKGVLNWGVKWRDRQGQYLLRENACRGYMMPADKNPRRPVATQDRFVAVRTAAERVTMQLRYGGRYQRVRSYLPELLDIANGTGRRIRAICELHYDDLRLNDGTPYGSIRWRADADKCGRETTVPIGPAVRDALDRLLADRPGLGAAPLFPLPSDQSRPLTRNLARALLKKAEALAGLPPLDGSLWHAYRRKWATERKHLPAPDVAAAGGWKETTTLTRLYQQPDPQTMLRVILEAGELREVAR